MVCEKKIVSICSALFKIILEFYKREKKMKQNLRPLFYFLIFMYWSSSLSTKSFENELSQQKRKWNKVKQIKLSSS